MKVLPNFVKKALPLLVILGVSLLAGAQSSAKQNKQAVVKGLVESQVYVFRAQSALPMSGRIRQLTTEYTLRVSKDTIISDLPYFGRAYTAPLDPTQGPLQFSTRDFDYTTSPGKKGGWTILIKPKDYKDVQQLQLSVTVDGYAYLQVNSLSRQPISFNGVIAPRRR